MVVNWVINFKGPLLMLRYEDIRADSAGQVMRVLDFVNYKYDEEFVKRAVAQDFRFVDEKKKCLT